ncbi:MAG TPA: hypothetical protein VM243_06015 [Phycisphaerae bacterium]|nr:hypothetical protein [Phycisphaerae bacterium]
MSALPIRTEPPDDWVTPATLAAARRVSVRTVRHQISKLPEHARRKVGGKLYFDRRFLAGASLDLARIGKVDQPGQADKSLWRQADAQRDAVIRRILADGDTYARQRGVGLTKADREFAALHGDGAYGLTFNERTLRRWRSAAKAGRGFAERRGRKRGTDNGGLGQQAWQLFVRMALKLEILTEAEMVMRGEASRHAGDAAWRCDVSYSTLRIRFGREYPDFFREYVTRDPERWAAKHGPKLDRKPHDQPANHTWELDGTTGNVLCRDGERVGRPTVVLTGCPASGMILGVAVGRSESTTLIRRSAWQAYTFAGAPRAARIDLGKAFAGQGFGDLRGRKAAAESEVIGFVRMMQAELQDCTGRSPWQKGFIESMMRGVDRHDRHYTRRGYVGNRPKNRSRFADQLARKHPEKLLTFEEYEASLRAWWEAENRRPRRHLGKLSPLQKFQRTAIPERRLPRQAEDFLRRRPQRVRVGTRGVVVTIGGVRLHYGHRDPRVWERQGQELIAYIDEQDTASVLLCEVGGRPLFYAREDTLAGTDAESIAEAGKLQRKARKRARERFADLDLAAAPTVDVALELKRRAAEQAAARSEPADVPERGRIILHSAFDAALAEAERQEMRAAVGAECVSPPPGPTLAQLTNGASRDLMDGVSAFGFEDLVRVMEDHGDDLFADLT